jgi:hypothetical protein
MRGLAEGDFGSPAPPCSPVDILLAQCDASLLQPTRTEPVTLNDPMLRPHSVWDQQMAPETDVSADRRRRDS